MTRLEAVLATIEEQASRVDLQVERAQRLAEETERLRVTGSAARGAVTVTVDGVGQPVDVAFGGAWEQIDATRLGTAVIEAHQQATRRLASEVQRLSEAIYGEGSASASMVADSYRNRFGTEEDER